MSRFIFISLCLFILTSINHTVYAQDIPALGNYAVNITISEQVSEGDIISVTKQGFVRTTTPYDAQIYGIVASSPIISFLPRNETTTPVITNGDAKVRVSTKNGPIEIGDIITSSETAGVGQKVTQSGYVLGKALAEYTDQSKEGLIPVEVNIGYVDVVAGGQGPRGFLSQALNWRWLLGFIIGLLTILSAIYAFVKFINTGIVAVGRNPLAKRTIIVSMLIALTAVVVLAAVGLSVAAVIIGIDQVTNIWRK